MLMSMFFFLYKLVLLWETEYKRGFFIYFLFNLTAVPAAEMKSEKEKGSLLNAQTSFWGMS